MFASKPYSIRNAFLDNLLALERLLIAYANLSSPLEWNNPKAGPGWFCKEFRMVVAEAENRKLVGFAVNAVVKIIDHCIRGGMVIDLFVESAQRGCGVAMQIIMATATQIQQQGGVYIKEQAVENPSVQRLYQRCAQCFSGADCYVFGRAFRQLIELSGQNLRDIVKNLPEPAWNYEPRATCLLRKRKMSNVSTGTEGDEPTDDNRSLPQNFRTTACSHKL